MPPVKIGPKHQITIPKEVFSSLHLEVGDFLDTQIQNNAIVLVPKKLVDKDQAWFWTKEWQEKERQADKAIEKGDVSRTFSKASDALKALKKK